ncbi:MAG: hypothetical protein P1U57_14900, partial [Oleibacter sp.]|nr:hypothetical protein [Thalassolituus sp.]
DITLRFLLLPIYSQLREQRSQPLGQARLQFFGGYIHAKLATRLTEIPDAKDSITLVLANTTYDDDLELLLLAILVRQLGVRILRLAGLTQAPDIAELINTLSLQGALIKAPDQANDVQLKQLQNLSVETGQLIFVSGNTPAQADVLRRRGLMPLSGDIQQDARTIRDVLAGINS